MNKKDSNEPLTILKDRFILRRNQKLVDHDSFSLLILPCTIDELVATNEDYWLKDHYYLDASNKPSKQDIDSFVKLNWENFNRLSEYKVKANK